MTRPDMTPFAAFALALMLGSTAFAQNAHAPLVRIADLVIDPAQLDAYTEAVREEMSTSVRVEPGVLAINCVAEKNAPNRLHFFEVYADAAAYDSHIASLHFKKYVETTKMMIMSRQLLETVPVQLNAKKGGGQP